MGRKISLFLMILLTLGTGFYMYQKEQTERKVTEEEVIFVKEEKRESASPLFTEDGYYYQLLTKEDQSAYQILLKGLQEQKEMFAVPEHADIEQICKRIGKDHPEIFWWEGAGEVFYYEDSVKFCPKYVCSKKERKNRQKEIDKKTEQLLQDLPQGEDEYLKVKYIYETVINHVDYQEDAEDGQNLYSAIILQKSVCAGYAKMTKYLLDQCGIDCVYVTGKVSSGESHAWNLCMCNGQYYWIDTTWGDPVYIRENGETGQEGISYDYLLCSDEMMEQTHLADLSYPSCTSIADYYYTRENSYITEYNAQEMLTVIEQRMERETKVHDF